MSVSRHRNRADRRTEEVADLRGKAAAENAKAAEHRAKARKVAESLSRTSSGSTAKAKARKIERHEQAAADHDKSAARLERRMGTKRRSLSSAQDTLDRTLAQEHTRQHREAERRRKEDIDHLHEIEQRRRRAQVWPQALRARPVPPILMSNASPAAFDDHYDVCLSFAGEQRGYVELVAEGLKQAHLNVFYDQDDEIAPRLWGRDLTEYLDYVYRVGSRFCVMFISAQYAQKEWTRWERRSALDRALREDGEYILPARFDDIELPGLRPSVGYLNLRELAPASLVEMIVRKLAES